MNNEKFLIYIDILGFEHLPRELAVKIGFDEDWIREKAFLVPFRQLIQDLPQNNDVKIDYLKEGTDSCLIIVPDFDSVLQIIEKFSNINLPRKVGKTKKIPVEIGVDFLNYRNDNCDDPIATQGIISSLKKNFFCDYKQWHKLQYDGSIKESYIIISESVFKKLGHHQKNKCETVPSNVQNLFLLPLKVINQELKIRDFLSAIGKSRSDASGAFIDTLFVPPVEYDDIINSFQKERIVFLSGPVGYGKTYLAIRLLWQWYETGYTPQWIKGGEFIERHEGRTFLEEIDALNASNQVIYVEDPFGNVEYEKREKLSQEIHKVIDFIHQEQNVFLILTSKKDVFEQFKKDTLSEERINEIEKELNILKPSYDYARRKSILDKWANNKNCNWYKNPKLKKYVLTLLKKDENLPTPLSIHDFVESSTNINDENDLKNLIRTHSESSEKVFAKEIIGLYNSRRRDRVLLLCFVLISDNIDLNFVKMKYNQLKEENFEDFSTLLEHEYRLSKELSRFRKSSDNSSGDSFTLTFSHPSYRAAVPIILNDSGCNAIFCEVLKRLSDQKESVNYVIGALLKYFEKIPSDIGNHLIQKIYETHIKKQLKEYQIRRIRSKTKNYDDKSIIDLYDKFYKTNQFSWLIIKYYDKLNDNNREIVFKLLKNFDASSSIVEAITHHYKALPKKIQDVLEDLSDDDMASNISDAVYGHIDDIPASQRNEIIIKLFNNKLTKKSTISLIAANYTSLPKKIREIFTKPYCFRKILKGLCGQYVNITKDYRLRYKNYY